MDDIYGINTLLDIRKILNRIISSDTSGEFLVTEIDEETEHFIYTFLDSYKNTVLELSSTYKLNDILESFNLVTPQKFKKGAEESFNKFNNRPNNTEEGKNFLKTMLIYTAFKLLKGLVSCVQKFKQEKINNVCLIYSVMKDNNLSELSNRIGFIVPNKDENIELENREKVVKGLKRKYDKIDVFPDYFLYALAMPFREPYNEYIERYIKYYYIFRNADDFTLETTQRIYSTMFPLKSSIDKDDLKIFIKNETIREYVKDFTLKILLFYGFKLDKKHLVVRAKPLNRKSRGLTIGLYSEVNYDRITRILSFLLDIEMYEISTAFFLAMCKAVKSDKKLNKVITEGGFMNEWVKTQPYLVGRKIQGIKYEEEEEEEEEESHTCKTVGLEYNGNSCYMDSALLCLLAIPNKVITDSILNKNLDLLKGGKIFNRCSKDVNEDIEIRKNIQKVLINITESMRGGTNVKNCENLRKVIKNCPGSQEFHKPITQDSGEFLAYLFNIFQVGVAQRVVSTYGGNVFDEKGDMKLITQIADDRASPIIDIPATALLELKMPDITQFINVTTESPLDESNFWIPDATKPDVFYTHQRQAVEIISSPYIVFNVLRKHGEPVFEDGKFKEIKTVNIWKEVVAPEKFVLKDKELELSGIVVHTGGAHYVANFKCDGEWYWYNDLPDKKTKKHTIKYTGSYEQMLATKPDPMSHGTLFFYT